MRNTDYSNIYFLPFFKKLTEDTYLLTAHYCDKNNIKKDFPHLSYNYSYKGYLFNFEEISEIEVFIQKRRIDIHIKNIKKKIKTYKDYLKDENLDEKSIKFFKSQIEEIKKELDNI